MATLTGKLVADTYKALLKLIDNDVVTATEKQVSDGYGGGTGLFIDQNGFIRASKFTVTGGNSSQFLKGDGSLDSTSYLSVASASSTYLTISNASSTYLTIANASSTYLPIGSTTSAIAEGSRLYFTQPRVLATPLTGFVSTSGNVTSSDTVLSSIEKIWWNIVNGGGGGGGGYVPYVGATQDLNLGTYGLISDFIQLNTTNDVIPTSVGVMSWNNTDGTANLKLKGGNVTLQIGQEQVARVVNGSGGTLLESNYQVVKIIGAQGQRLQVGLAQADNDANSKDTIGLVTETIANNQEGFVTVSGLVNEIDTTGDTQGETWVDGDTLYLSGILAGGLTNVKPQAPTHTVIVGFVVYAHQNHGKIFVKVDNGYELDELHNVQITSVADKNILVYDSTLMVWQNQNIFGTQGYLPFYDDNLLMKDSVIYTNGTNVGIGSTTLTEKLVVNGNILASQFKRVGGLSTQFLKADGSIDSTQYQPYSADLTAIDALALTTGLLRKNGTDTWELDQTEYISLAYGTSTYQTYANLSSNLTASATKYPSVNAVNTGLGLKLNLTGGTLTGDLTLNYSYPKIALSDISSGTIWNIENDGSTFELNYGATNKFYIFSSGNAAFSNDLTANKLIKAGGLSTEFLKADGSVDSTNYQPYDADLAAIAALALTTGLLRKNGMNTWELDQTEYLSFATANSTFQTLANLSSNLNASSTKYPSVNAVNTGLNLRLALTGGTLSGDLAISSSIPTLQLSDTSSGTIWNIQNDGGGFEINSGITNKFVMYSSGNATFVNDLTANKFIKSGGTSAQFLMADGSVSSGNAGTVTSVGLSAPSGFSVSGSPVTSSGTLALGFAVGYSLPSDATQATWTAKQNALNGTGFVKIEGTTISYDNSTYYLASNPSGYISGITSLMVTNALGYTPYNATNPSGYISGITSGMVTTALGYTPVTNARQLTINGTTYDLSADRSWTISGTIGGLTSGYIPKATSASTLGNSLIYDNGTNIHIGGSSAPSKLTVSGDIESMYTTSAPTVNYLKLGTYGDGAWGSYIGAFSNYSATLATDLRFGTTTGSTPTEKMRITSDGNILVGTTTDNGAKLQLSGTLRFNYANYGYFGLGYISGADYGIFNYNYGRTDLIFTQSTGAATFINSASATSIRSSGVGTFGFNTVNNGEFQIYATAADGMVMAGRGSNTDMVITNKSGSDVFSIPTGTTIANFVGNVGINTSSPSEKLQISGGNAYISGVGNALLFDTDGSAKTITQYVTNFYEFHIVNGRGNTSRFILGNGSISLGTSLSPLFYINTTSGNILINTTTDSGYKLDVNGTLSIAKFNATATSGGYITLQKQGSDQLYLGSSTAISGIGTNIDFWATTGYGLAFYTNGIQRLSIATTGIATFSSAIIGNQGLSVSGYGAISNSANKFVLDFYGGYTRLYSLGGNTTTKGGYEFHTNSSDGSLDVIALGISSTGAATFNSSVLINGALNVGTSGSVSINAGSAATPLITQSSSYTEIYRRSGGVGIYLGGTTDPGNYYDNTVHYFRSSGGGTTYATINASGNLGLGVTPSAWASNYKSITSQNISLYGRTDDSDRAGIVVNGYYDNSLGFVYTNSAFATLYELQNGQHRWLIAPSGTAGTAISFTQAMTLDASGNLGVGMTSPTIASGYRSLILNGTSGTIIRTQVNGTNAFDIQADSGITYLWEYRNAVVSFGANGGEKMRLNPSGNFLIGTTTDSGYKLDVNGTGIVRGDALYVYDTGSIQLGRDTTYSTPYMALGFGGRSNGFNKIYGARDTTDGLYIHATTGRGIKFEVNGAGSASMELNSSGNLGLGVTPSAWSNNGNLDLQDVYLSLSSQGAYGGTISNNAYYNAGWKYKGANYATQYQTLAGEHRWLTAGVGGAAGNAISFTQAMTLDASGNLALGQTTALTGGGAAKWITLFGSSYSGGIIYSINGTASAYNYIDADSNFAIQGQTGIGFKVLTNGAEKMRITTGGNLLVGTTTDSGYKLDVNGTGRFSGNVTVGLGNALESLLVINGQTYSGLRFQRAGTTKWAIFNNNAGTDFIDFYNYTTSSSAFYISATNAATFSSSVTAGGDVTLSGNESYLYFSSTYTIGSNIRAKIRTVGAGGGSGYGGDLRFSTRTPSNTWNEDAMIIDSSGNVGIGTITPSTKMEIFGTEGTGARTSPYNVLTITAESGYLPYNGFGGGILFNNRAYGSGIVTSSRIRSVINNNSVDTSGGAIAFDVTSTVGGSLTQAMLINYNGYVGIGITPSRLLDVNGTMRIADGSSIEWGGTSTGISGTSSSNALLFYTTSTERMRITSDGSIGINNTNPLNTAWGSGSTTKQLSIDASGYAVINLQGGSRKYSMGAGGGDFYMCYDNTAARHNLIINSAGAATFSSSVTAGGNILVPAGSGLVWSGDSSRIMTPEDNVSGALIQTPGIIRFNAGSSEKMRITSGGNVLIGTTTDSGYKLDVNGTGRFTGNVVGNGFTANQFLRVALDGSDTIGAGGFLAFYNTAFTRGMATQLNASNGYDYWALSAGGWSKIGGLSQSGAATFSSSVSATSFIKTGGTSSQYLMADGSVTTSSGSVGGSGTTNYISKWNGTTSLANSQIFDNGTQVTVGSNVAMYKFAVNPVSNSYFGIGFTGTNSIFVNAVDSGFTSVPIVNNAISHEWLIGFGSAMLLTSSLNLLIGTTTGVSGGGKLQVNGDVNINGNFKINGTVIGGGGGSGITGSGTTNMIAKWTGGTALGDSALYDNGAYSMGIGTTSIAFPTDRKGLVIRPNGANSGEILLQNSGNTNGSTDGFAIANINGDGVALYNRINAHIRFGTNNTERLRITEDGNLGFNTNSQFGGGVKVFGINNCGTVPTSSSPTGGIIYVENGALKYRGQAGTVTTIANA